MKSLRNILVAVVLVSVVALVYLSYDSTAQLQKRTPLLTDDVVKGKEAWQRNNCINCHTILGNGAIVFALGVGMFTVDFFKFLLMVRKANKVSPITENVSI